MIEVPEESHVEKALRSEGETIGSFKREGSKWKTEAKNGGKGSVRAIHDPQ